MANKAAQKFSKNPLMEELLKESPDFEMPELGSMVEGVVVDINSNKILVDLNGVMTGIISGREAHDSADTVKNLQEGDSVLASIVELENPEGLIVLSLRKASQERTWRKFSDAYENGEVIEVKANEANKGGLLLDIDGIKGFIPVSQLAPLHYPRVDGADASKILTRLGVLIGETFNVKIISIDKENGKLILSEKAGLEQQRKKALKSLKIGQKVKGKISGIVKFGLFVAFDGLEGLVHISEIAWGHVKDPSDYGKLGDEVEVLVIGIEGEKISLSTKRLIADPWVEAAKMFTIGKIVKGTVNRITPFGAFMKLNDEINGLIHISEFSHDLVKDPHDIISVGSTVEAKIIAVDLDEHRIGLSIKAMKEPPVSVDILSGKLPGKPKEKKEEVAEVIEEKKKEMPEVKEEEKEKSEKKEKVSKEKEEKKKEVVEVKKEESLASLGLSKKIVQSLEKAGYKTLLDVKGLKKADLVKLEGVGEKTAEKIVDAI